MAADQNWDRMYATWPKELREPNFSGACSCLQAHVSFTLAGEGEALTHPLANFLERYLKREQLSVAFLAAGEKKKVFKYSRPGSGGEA